jgi:hypothetical protein
MYEIEKLISKVEDVWFTDFGDTREDSALLISFKEKQIIIGALRAAPGPLLSEVVHDRPVREVHARSEKAG